MASPATPRRGAAVFRIIHAAEESAESAPGQQYPTWLENVPLQLVAQECFDGLHEPLARLQHDIAGKAIAYNDIGDTAVNLASLDVADEIQRRGLEEAVRLPRQIVPLVLLRRCSSPTRGCSTPSATRAYTLPITAN